jgi:hypothetical protein
MGVEGWGEMASRAAGCGMEDGGWENGVNGIEDEG